MVRWLLKDGTEIHRIVLHQVYDYETNLPVFENGEPVFRLSGPLALIVEEAKRASSSTPQSRNLHEIHGTQVDKVHEYGTGPPALANKFGDDPDEIIVTIED
jgi:hypothetical protein